VEALVGGIAVKKEKSTKKLSFRRRMFITLTITVLAGLMVGAAFFMMQMRVPDMHIIFLLTLGISAILVIFLTLWTMSESKRFAKAARVLKRIYYICLAIGLVAFIVLQILIISGAHTQEANVDAIIVLGAGLRGDEPSVILQTRLNAAIEYARAREDVPIIVSGGLGAGRNITEAQAMFNYLTARGVDENIVWMEGASTNTYENLTFSRELMEERGLDTEDITVAVVSNEFHLFRARMIADNAGLEAVGVAAETPSVRLKALYFFREAIALANAILF